MVAFCVTCIFHQQEANQERFCSHFKLLNLCFKPYPHTDITCTHLKIFEYKTAWLVHTEHSLHQISPLLHHSLECLRTVGEHPGSEQCDSRQTTAGPLLRAPSGWGSALPEETQCGPTNKQQTMRWNYIHMHACVCVCTGLQQQKCTCILYSVCEHNITCSVHNHRCTVVGSNNAYMLRTLTETSCLSLSVVSLS